MPDTKSEPPRLRSLQNVEYEDEEGEIDEDELAFNNIEPKF